MKKNWREWRIPFWLALALALPFFYSGIRVWGKAASGVGYDAWGEAIMFALAGTVLLLIGATILALPLAERFSGWTGAILWSEERGKPEPAYSIPEALLKRERYAEALEEFEKLSQQFPEEFRPYQAMLEITLIHQKDRKRAGAIYQRGMRALKQAEQRELLRKIYNALLARELPDTETDS
jgi:tetratricopeptide (TPR) repeat protein